MNRTVKWLLESDPWVEYRTRRDILNQPEDDEKVQEAKQQMLRHSKIKQLIEELSRWPGETVNSHKKAGLLIHKLSFIAETGLTVDNTDVKNIADNVMRHITDDGVPEVLMNIPVHFGGTGRDDWAWALCDAPLILFSLAKMGMADDDTVRKGLGFLAALTRDNGWPCTVSPKLGKFRGPGSKGDPCPYATLIMMKALAAAGDMDGPEAHTGAECLLDLWTRSKEAHPYQFYMGTDYRKLKAPFVWYDIVHTADVLSQFKWLKNDARLIEITDIIEAKANTDDSYTPESVWKAWDGFDFGQKKTLSAWLTFLVLRILKRMKNV